MNRLGEGLLKLPFTHPQFPATTACGSTRPQPSCFLVSNYLSTNSFLERGDQGQPWSQTLHPYLYLSAWKSSCGRSP